MGKKPVLFLFMLAIWLPSWCQAGETIKDESCLKIMTNTASEESKLPPNIEKYPALVHLCDLVFEFYQDKKYEELVLLEKYEEIYEKRLALEAPETEEERMAWQRTYDLINLQETENGLDIAKNQTILRHYEALFSILEKFVWQKDFDEKVFWQAWEEAKDRGHDLIYAINLARINVFSLLMNKYESLNNPIEKERIQKKLDRLKTSKSYHAL
jgi:hypothetical protein